MSPKDGRGQHSNRPHKIDDGIRQSIRDHIARFPTYETHYGRRQGNTTSRYLDPALSIASMYRAFRDDQRNAGRTIPKKWLYSHIFKTEFNLSFGSPKLDSCDKCDKLKAQLAGAERNKKDELQQILDLHHAISKSNWKIYIIEPNLIGI